MIPGILRAASPGPLVDRALARDLPGSPTLLLAVGKAGHTMADAAAARLGAERALVLAPPPAPPGRPALRRLEVDHPVPTPRNVDAARAARTHAAALGPSDILLVLLSGGASAMLCLPRPPLTLDDLAAITDALLRAGAPIEELNAVRKHCEVLKGGGLAAACPAGRIVTLILSDVPGDRLDVIGSGPTAPDPTTFADALAVLERRSALNAAPAVTALLRRGVAGTEPETVKPDSPLWARVENIVIGNNRLALDAACAEAMRLGYAFAERRELVEGEAADVGRRLALAALAFRASGRTRACIAWGGETTVTVGDAAGRGGRNQELALAAAIELAGTAGVTIMSLATDGRDGPTDAAGAIVDGSMAARMRDAAIDAAHALRTHDSHRALDAAGALVRTGPTGTNVNDLMIALVD